MAEGDHIRQRSATFGHQTSPSSQFEMQRHMIPATKRLGQGSESREPQRDSSTLKDVMRLETNKVRDNGRSPGPLESQRACPSTHA